MPTNLPKLSESNISQQIWSCILNYKQEPKDLKRYNDNENHWRKAKENWADAISAAKYEFFLKYDYIPPDKLDPYACNNSGLSDRYIFKIIEQFETFFKHSKLIESNPNSI